MPRLAGIEGHGRVTLQTASRGERQYVGLLVFDMKHSARFVEFQRSGAPVTYSGPAHTKHGMQDIVIDVVVTRVENPQTSGVRVHFVSTGDPERV